MKIVDTSIVRKSIELNENFKLVIAKDQNVTVSFWNGETEILICEGNEAYAKGISEIFSEAAKVLAGIAPKQNIKRGRKPKQIKVGEE